MNPKKHLPTLLILLLGAANALFAQTYCDLNDCLFWHAQPEPIDSATLVYKTNAWSIDEWDNIACNFPVQQCENLSLDLYYPQLTGNEKRPLVLLIHGGAFIEGDKSAFRAQARKFARLGYVPATITYRLCKRNNCLLLDWAGDENPALMPALICNLNFWSDFGTGAYVATLDAHDALRFLQNNAAQYGIDPQNVIVGGHSAGAWTALHMAFLSQNEADSMGGWSGIWGPLNPASGIKGVISLSGAVFDTAHIDASEQVPIFAVHGACDAVVCYDQDAPFHCNANYPQIQGGGNIALRAAHQGLPYYLFSGDGMGHSVEPMQEIWEVELLRFMREIMLCGAPAQLHAVATQSPASGECAILQSPVLQAPHAPRAVAALAQSPLWGSLPACQATGISAAANAPVFRIFPTQTAGDHITVELSEPAVLTIYNLHGQELKRQALQPGAQQVALDPSMRGVLLFVLTDKNRRIGAEKIMRW